MLCLEHLVVCSHPKPLLGKCFSHTWLPQMLPFHFGCGDFLKLWKLTTLMNHLGGMVIAWRVVRIMECHPWTKRFVSLHCFRWLPVQPYGIWALPRCSKLWGFILFARQADVAEYRWERVWRWYGWISLPKNLVSFLLSGRMGLKVKVHNLSRVLN